MKSALMNVSKRFVCVCLMLACYATVSAQYVQTKRPNLNINPNLNGLIEALPTGYTTTERYPLLIFFMGINSTGPGTDASLESMFGSGGGFIHDQIRSGTFPASFTVNGQTHKFIVLTPQFVTDFNTRLPTPEEVNSLIDYAIANYSIDTTRIYLTGNSSGGGPVWDYVGASSAYANRIAAILPFSGVSFPTQTKANVIRNAGVAVWAFHNDQDPGVPLSFTEDYIRFINNPTPAPKEAKKTINNSTGHDSWWNAYMRVYTENGMNIYEWMLQFQRPVTNAKAGNDVEFDLPTNSVQLQGAGTGPNGTVASYNWTKVSGPPATFSSSTVANPTVSNLSAGTYTFRLSITDNAGAVATDDVVITVNAQPMRIQAEAYTTMSGVTLETTTDEGGGQNVSFIDQGDWMDYSVNVPVAGQYTVRFRVASFMAGAGFRLLNSTGGELANVEVFNTNGWQNWMTLYETVTLPAGVQTLRVQSSNAPGWNFNWMELVANSQAPLPVNFVLFNAQCANGAVNLQWKTAGEQNARNFSVERSANGRDWTSITSIPASGQTTEEKSYSYKDVAPGVNNFYRIVETDMDGKKTITSVLRTACGGRAGVTVFPNPVADKAVVQISLEKAARVSLTVLDSKGAVVRRQEAQVPVGSSQVTVDMQSLPKGNYTLVARWDAEKQSVKLLKN